MDDPQEVKAQLKVFGSNLRRARVARMFTLDALSEKANLHIRVLQKMEAGETNVLITTAMRLQRALGCPWQELFSGLPPPRKAPGKGREGQK
jgi:transcriptional regulator with XRE-family HTH domain